MTPVRFFTFLPFFLVLRASRGSSGFRKQTIRNLVWSSARLKSKSICWRVMVILQEPLFCENSPWHRFIYTFLYYLLRLHFCFCFWLCKFTFLHHFIPSPWRWLSKHTYFFFINPFKPNFSTYIDMQKNSVYNTLWKSLSFTYLLD
jgi:hypothetical protein